LQVLGRRKAHAALPRIAALALHPDDNVGIAAIEAMGRIGGTDTVEPLSVAVRSRNFFRAFPAIDALGRTGDPRAIEPLVALLDDAFYAAEASRALGRTGQEAAVAPLGGVLNRGSDALVRTAALALCDLRDRYEARFGDATAILSELRRLAVTWPLSVRVSEAIAGAVVSEQVALASVLGWIGDEPAIARLLELLEAEAAIAQAAADSLRRIGPDAALLLLNALRQGSSALRARLLPLIGHSRSPVTDLVACLDDPDPSVRALACDALARAGNTSVVPALFRLLGDQDLRVSQASASAIQSLGSMDTKRLALVEARSSDVRARRAALRILAYFGYPEGLDILVEAMGDPDPRAREAAIQGLPLIDDKRALAALLSVSKDESPKSRAAAMRALGNTSDSAEVVEALRRGLEDADSWVRYYSCKSLAKLKVRSATEAIVARMDDEAGQVRVGAVEALGQLRTDGALVALARAATSPDDDIRRGALVGLGVARNKEYMPILREALASTDRATRIVAIAAIAEFDLAEVVPLLANAATDPEENVRGAAIGFLSTRSGPEATQALLDQLGNPAIRDRVMAALAVAPDERIEGILMALERADADSAPMLMTALTRMRHASSLAAVAAALTLDNVHARRAAAAALVATGTKEALEAVRRAGSDDPDSEVRRIGTAAMHQ
jgi:HEAT repeat protein